MDGNVDEGAIIHSGLTKPPLFLGLVFEYMIGLLTFGAILFIATSSFWIMLFVLILYVPARISSRLYPFALSSALVVFRETPPLPSQRERGSRYYVDKAFIK